jgi:hypothetical protein
MSSTSSSETNGPCTRWMRPPPAMNSMSPMPSSCSAPMLAENGAAVDLRGHLEADAGREVGLDRTGDDIDRRTLRRHDDVDACGTRHLREALDCALDVLAGDHHQVGHLVDDDDDIGHWLERSFPRSRRSASPVSRSKPVCTVRVIGSPFWRPLDPAVEAVDVAHTELRHLACSALPSRGRSI